MNNEETTKKNVKPNGSLMKHTKAQLVDIILRKDNIEKELRENSKQVKVSYQRELIHANNYYDALNDKYNKLSKEYDNLKIDYQDICDEKATEEIILKCSRNRWQIFSFVLLMILMFELVYCIL